MQKKILSKIAALSIAGLTAIPSLSLVSSADLSYNQETSTGPKTASGTIWTVTETVYNSDGTIKDTYETRYDSKTAAERHQPTHDGKITSRDYQSLTSFVENGGTIYVSPNGEVFKESGSGRTPYKVSGSGTNPGNNSNNGYYNGNSYYSDTIYHSVSADRFYPNLQAYLNDPANTDTRNPVGIPVQGASYNSASGFVYFDVKGGYYTSSASNTTIYISNGSSSSNSSSTASSTYPWYSSYTGRFYKTKADARDASLNDSQVYYVGNGYYDGYYYYSTYTGKYYKTYSEAVNASQNSSQVIYVGNGYYNGYWNYNDPYYAYFYGGGDLTGSGSSSNSSSAYSITISGTSSWNTLANRIKLASTGRTFNVNMKEETIIPSSVLSALKGKDITLDLKLDNGVIYTINGKNVTSTKEVNIITTYNTERIPETLVKKAYQKYNAVSTAQISVNSNSFGAKVGITVKFATKRAGCTARLYRYNPDKRSLSLVDTSTVTSAGQCKFEGVAKGGDFVIVLS